MTTYRKKLIEVALPLDAINAGCVKDKERKTRHIRNLHKWFAPMPLAAWRTMLFAAIVDDPGERLPPDEAATERRRLLHLIERLAPFDANADAQLLADVHQELLRATGGELPTIVDPFCGGGSTLLEASRLGLPTRGIDLNPIAVLISKVLVEFAAEARGAEPVSPEAERQGRLSWHGLSGFEADVRYYARVVQERTWRRVGHVYPLGPDGNTVKCWRWARAVPSPDPVFMGRRTPVVSNWWLSKKKNQKAWIQPEISEETIEFRIATSSSPPPPTKRGQNAYCIFSQTPMSKAYLRQQGRNNQISQMMMALVTSTGGGSAYYPPNEEQQKAAQVPHPEWVPDLRLPANPRWFSPPAYGLSTHASLFTSRQLVVLSAFAEEIAAVAHIIEEDASAATRDQKDVARDPRKYASSIVTFLGLCLGKLVQSNNALVRWYIDSRNGASQPLPIFDRQAIPMIWDFTEVNPFGGSVGDWSQQVETALSALSLVGSSGSGRVEQGDASAIATGIPRHALIATDPPYFDNIGYADLADFFYVWIRRAIGTLHPRMFKTVLSPKASELIADPYRHDGDRSKAEQFFRDGFSDVFASLRGRVDGRYPTLIVYSFKQKEKGGALQATGWEAMLDGLLRAGFAVVGTWPLRTSRKARMIGLGTNALASAVVVVCRPRSDNAGGISRSQFMRVLRQELRGAVRLLQSTSIAPVDLAQAAIGPGMSIYSRYAKVLEGDGSVMPVGTALQLINRVLDEYLSEQTGDFDSDTRFAVTWFENHRFDAGDFGDAETLAMARNLSVKGVVEAGIAHSAGGKVRLLMRSELPEEWSPEGDARLTVWEGTQHLIKRLVAGGERAAADLLRQLGDLGAPARDLAYRLYQMCEGKGWAEEARAYNDLVVAWPELARLAKLGPADQRRTPAQETLV